MRPPDDTNPVSRDRQGSTQAPAPNPAPAPVRIIRRIQPRVFKSNTIGLSGLVKHPATPVRVFDLPEGLMFYMVGSGITECGPWIAHIDYWRSKHAEAVAPVVLFNGMDKRMIAYLKVEYLPLEEILRVWTTYADGKPYVFTIDAADKVNHIKW